MEFEEEKSEVCFTVKIPSFSSYTDFDDTFTTEFPLKVNKFSSLWRLNLSLFAVENGCDGVDPINRDIAISLKCLSCNVNLPEIEVYSKVQGRDQHEKQLQQRDFKELKWHGTLVSRLGLKVFRLLSDDQLTANLKFVLKGSDMSRAVGGVEGLAKDMRVLMSRGTYSDVDILTSDGIRIPAHLALLQLRSNLAERVTVPKKRHLVGVSTPEPHAKTLKTELFPSNIGNRASESVKEEAFPLRVETPINSTFGSISSGYQSCSSTASSPDRYQGILNSGKSAGLTLSSEAVTSKTPNPNRQNSKPPIKERRSCTPNQVLFRPRKTTPRRLSQAKSASSPHNTGFTSREGSPERPPVKSSPSTPKRTPLRNLPPTPKRITPGRFSLAPARSSPTKHHRLGLSPTKKSKSPASLSISKRSLPSRRCSVGRNQQTLPKTPSPQKRATTPMVRLSSQNVQRLRRTPLIGSPSPRRRLYQSNEQLCKDSDDDVKPLEPSLGVSARGGIPLKGLQFVNVSGSPFKTQEVDIDANEVKKPEIRVNMSASVTRALLEWIYTGECSSIDNLSRALLVGGIRHGVSGLARACEYYLTAALTPTNAPEIIFLAQKYSAYLLQDAALNYAVKEAVAVTSQPIWGSLGDRAPAMVLEFSRRLAAYSGSCIKAS